MIESSNARVGVKVIAEAEGDVFTSRMTQDGGAAAGFRRRGGARPKRSPAPPASRASRARRAIAAIALFLAALCASHAARAEAFDVSDPGWEGASELLEIARGELRA